VGGALGAVCRWAVDSGPVESGSFPWPTLLINLAGCLAIGLLPALVVVRRSAVLEVLVGPGFLGGFTTMSAYADQSRSLVASGHLAAASAYVVVTLVGCLAAVTLARACVTSRSPASDLGRTGSVE
jgi:CrcB protein